MITGILTRITSSVPKFSVKNGNLYFQIQMAFMSVNGSYSTVNVLMRGTKDASEFFKSHINSIYFTGRTGSFFNVKEEIEKDVLTEAMHVGDTVPAEMDNKDLDDSMLLDGIIIQSFSPISTRPNLESFIQLSIMKASVLDNTSLSNYSFGLNKVKEREYTPDGASSFSLLCQQNDSKIILEFYGSQKYVKSVSEMASTSSIISFTGILKTYTLNDKIHMAVSVRESYFNSSRVAVNNEFFTIMDDLPSMASIDQDGLVSVA